MPALEANGNDVEEKALHCWHQWLWQEQPCRSAVPGLGEPGEVRLQRACAGQVLLLLHVSICSGPSLFCLTGNIIFIP